jgi:hypothetical protein
VATCEPIDSGAGRAGNELSELQFARLTAKLMQRYNSFTFVTDPSHPLYPGQMTFSLTSCLAPVAAR